MKQLCLLASTLLSVHVAFAQHNAKKMTLSPAHSQIVASLLAAADNSTSAAAKTTAGVAATRVIAQSTWDNDLGLLADTIKLGYAGSHYSTYDYNSMLYPYNYQYSNTPVFNNAQGIFGKPQVLYDTLTRWQIDPNTLTFGYYETAYATYNKNMSLTDYTDLFADSVHNPNVRYNNKFNKVKSIDTAYTYRWHTGIADNTFRQFYTYNASGTLTADSTFEMHLGVWRLASASIYTYDGSANLTQIDNYTNTTDTSFLLPLVEKYKYVNSYDASHRLLTVSSSYFDGTSLNPYIRDTFAYTGTLPFHTSWKEYQLDPINAYWAPMFYMHKAISTSLNLPDTVYIDGFDSLLDKWIPQTRDVMVYNSNHDPVKLQDYEYNFTAFPGTPDFVTTYYYDSYTNTVNTENNIKSIGTVSVFPNPSSGNITIEGIDASPQTNVLVTVINSAGQVMNRSGIPWRKGIQLSVSHLVRGMYWVTVQDAGGNMLGRQSFIKQ